MSGADHALHGLLHAWQGVGVLFGPGVEATKVNAKPERPILLPHQHHGIAPWRLGGSDGATVQHLLYCAGTPHPAGEGQCAETSP